MVSSVLAICAVAAAFVPGKVAFFGDSITEGGRYLTHMQLFSALRHPGEGVECHNVGKSGDTAKGGLTRWSWEGRPVAADRVFVMFGMNDSKRSTLPTAAPTNAADVVRREGIVSSYRQNMDALLDLIGKDCKNVTVMTPTPYDQYGPQTCKPFLGGNEPMLTDFARIVRELAAKRGLKTVDLHKPMTDLLKAHPEANLIGGDRVHPTDAGQYLMACLCLEATGADPFVEQTTVDAAGRGTFDFTYAPKALPLPITDLYRAIEKVWPVTERLNREMLLVTNLPSGRYALKADGREIGRYSAAELASGVNLALLDTPNARRAARAEHLRARLHRIACDFRSVIYLVQWMDAAKVSRTDKAACATFFAEQREKAKTLSWGGWHRHCVSRLEQMLPQWDALKAEEQETRTALRAVRPAVSRFSVEKLGDVHVWRLPPETVTNGFCSVSVGGKALDVFLLPQPEKVFPWQKDERLRPYGAVFFEADDEVEVAGTFASGKSFSFRARPPFTRAVEDGGRHGALVVCANRRETDVPDRNDPKVKWFDPGLHREPEVRLVSGQTLYLAPGAVVESHIIAEGKDISVRGRGIMSGNPWKWNAGPQKQCWLFRGERISIRDVTFAGGWYWSLVLDLTKDVTIDGIRILNGKVLNDDGIDVCRSENVTIRNAFIRTQDDCIAPKWWCRNLLVEDCTFWVDWANAVRIGWECDSGGGAFENLTFRNIDVLHLSMEKRPARHEWFNSCFCIQASNGIRVRNVSFANVNVSAYEPGDILFVAYSGDCGPYKGGGTIDGVALRNFTTPAEAKMTTRLAAEKPGQIRNVTFDRVSGWTAPELVNADAPSVVGAKTIRPAFADGKGMFSRRLGMFIHWGVYATGAFHEQAMWMKDMTRPDYEAFVDGFTTEKFDADRFVDIAESAGAEYIVITTKHHDGFCLWDTATTDFCAPKSPAKRDLIGDLAAACRRRGMGLGFYYSNPDWHCPFARNPKSTHQLKLQPGDTPDLERYAAYEKAQIRELLTKYGEICCWFWDIPTGVKRPEMDALVRALQPKILINDRGWEKTYRIGGDYGTPERDFNKGGVFAKKTEACNSIGKQSWGYRANDDYHSVGLLERGIDGFLACGGNYLLNIGPRADGTVPDEMVRTMADIGSWLARVRESFVGVESVPKLVKPIRNSPHKWIKDHDEPVGYLLTRRGDTLYVHFPNGVTETGVDLAPLAVRPLKATLLNTGAALKTCVEMMPSNRFHFGRESLHVWGIPVGDFADECLVLRLDFAPGELGRILEGVLTR